MEEESHRLGERVTEVGKKVHSIYIGMRDLPYRWRDFQSWVLYLIGAILT